jgi:AraC-like DNA-binding protein
MTNDELLDAYAPTLATLLPLARKAYGSRDIESIQHTASREYTRLLCQFYEGGGSLLDLSKRLGVTYASLHRRVTTSDLAPRKGTTRVKYSDSEYTAAVSKILEAKSTGTPGYHQCLKDHYDMRYSMARIAREMGLSSANPLYYGINRARLDSGLE